MAMDVSARNHQAELMDDPALDVAAHRQALMGLRRINSWRRADNAVWKVIREFGAHSSPAKPLTILDIASGGGDLAVRLARSAQRDRVSLTIDGCDISPTATAFASEQSAAAKFTNITFHQCNALEHPFPRAKYDIVMCSLFLHHLTEEHAVGLLQRMKAAANRLVVIDDLRRTRFGYWLAWLGCRLLTRCRVVHLDGPMSVEGAFSPEEARSIAERAGLIGAAIRTHWPQRLLLTWRPENEGVDEVSRI